MKVNKEETKVNGHSQDLAEEIVKQLKKGPEQEKVVGPLVQYLLSKGYKLEQIRFGKKEWRVPKNPSEATERERGNQYEGFPVDIAIFDSPEMTGKSSGPSIIIETKQPKEEAGISQLEIYMSLEPSVKLGIWANSADPSAPALFLYRGVRYPRHKLIKDIPSPGQPIAPEGAPLRYKDLVTPSQEALRRTFSNLMDYLASKDANVVRPDDRLNELCNLILLKLESDRKAKAEGEEAEVRWRALSSPEATAQMIRKWFHDFTRIYPELFTSEEERTIRLQDDSIHQVVQALERYRLLEAGSEAVSQAFQVLRTEALRSADGQFFTPQQVIEAGVKLVDVKWDDLVIDPACGTGGFLIEAFFSLTNRATGDPTQAIRWAQTHLYGVDKDHVAVKLAKAVMQIGGDGSAHIFRGDSIRRHEWPKSFPHLQSELREGRFDLVLTNPPFGKDLVVMAEDLDKGGFSIHRVGGSSMKKVPIGLVFLDLAYWLLKPGGRVGIILPETYFFSRSYQWVLKWLRGRFRPLVVANVPMEAFQEYARAKTSFFVFEKVEGEPDLEGEVLFLNPQTCGIGPDGKTIDSNELLDHVSQVKNGELPPGAARVKLKEVYERGVLVPRYYDPRYEEGLNRLLKEKGIEGVSLGELVEEGLLEYRFGHGSPDRLSRKGEIPYIKVSDLRAGRVNVNPTNLLPKEVAKKLWKGEESGLRAWDLLTPIRASSNIGEFAVLLPGEEERVLTKEILVLRATEKGRKKGYTPFYLFWALSLAAVREAWRRITLMQTNREDVGDYWKEVRIPKPPNSHWAESVSRPVREYLEALAQAQKALLGLESQEKEGFSFVPFLRTRNDEQGTEASDAEEIPSA
jgi:type I restriction enzyme M protein